jgi:hypothetical protein
MKMNLPNLLGIQSRGLSNQIKRTKIRNSHHLQSWSIDREVRKKFPSSESNNQKKLSSKWLDSPDLNNTSVHQKKNRRKSLNHVRSVLTKVVAYSTKAEWQTRRVYEDLFSLEKS